MLALVVRAIADSGAVGAVVVVSSDEEVLRLAASLDPLAYPLSQDLARPGLNLALEDARAWAARQGAAGLLVISGDLPLLSPSDVRALVRRDAPVVIAPDRHGLGTNALLLRFGS
jgi:2-phospho-L-lactate guanylyltransferase